MAIAKLENCSNEVNIKTNLAANVKLPNLPNVNTNNTSQLIKHWYKDNIAKFTLSGLFLIAFSQFSKTFVTQIHLRISSIH